MILQNGCLPYMERFRFPKGRWWHQKEVIRNWWTAGVNPFYHFSMLPSHCAHISAGIANTGTTLKTLAEGGVLGGGVPKCCSVWHGRVFFLPLPYGETFSYKCSQSDMVNWVQEKVIFHLIPFAFQWLRPERQQKSASIPLAQHNKLLIEAWRSSVHVQEASLQLAMR